ncbi:hypothetical protein DL93DRAFT_290488 [Clavulina sp. PMI_390]|nr:hypothetical protein DL93DRAFT_290488 [Clavulina sp. PMI_390]
MILSHLPHDSLHTMALLNSSWCLIVTPRIWVGFTIKDSTGADDLYHRVNSLIRFQSRMRSLRRLTIGPCTWRWTLPLLKAMVYVWRNSTRLSELFLESLGLFETEKVGDFRALLLTLIECAPSLRLTTFKLEALVSNDSLLRQFLELQPSIKCLIGIFTDSESSHHFPPSSFLPQLTTLRLRRKCFPTAIALVPNRPVTEVWLDTCGEVTKTQFDEGLLALQQSTTLLTSLSISGYWGRPSGIPPADWVEYLQTAFPRLQYLNIPDWPQFPLTESYFHFSELRALRIRLDPSVNAKHFIATLSSMEKLQTLYIKRSNEYVWTRTTRDSSQPEWCEKDCRKFECPYDHPTRGLPQA